MQVGMCNISLLQFEIEHIITNPKIQKPLNPWLPVLKHHLNHEK